MPKVKAKPNKNRKVRYEELLPHEAVAERRKYPVAYLPIGTIEWHGEQNCLGLDTVKIHALAMRCAQSTGGLVFPPLYYGEPREHYLMEANARPAERINIAKKMELNPDNFKTGYLQEKGFDANFDYTRLLHKILVEIHSLGFRVIVVMAGHYPLLYHARAACELFNLDYARYRKPVAWACTGYELVRDEIPEAGDHAAAWETSLMLALRPDLVNLSRLPKGAKEKLVGVHGRDPRRFANEQFGRRGVEAIVKKISIKVAELLK